MAETWELLACIEKGVKTIPLRAGLALGSLPSVAPGALALLYDLV